MPLSIDVLLVMAAFICAVYALAGKVSAAVPALLLCILEALRLVGR